jgi:phosphoglycerol transferase MdoB-like AlkP superfamily enzyme
MTTQTSTISIGPRTYSSPSLLGIAFIVLKLTHTIAWSWLWVTSPFWIPVVLFLVLLSVAIVIAVLTDG